MRDLKLHHYTSDVHRETRKKRREDTVLWRARQARRAGPVHAAVRCSWGTWLFLQEID